jgi:hypothetical protein
MYALLSGFASTPRTIPARPQSSTLRYGAHANMTDPIPELIQHLVVQTKIDPKYSVFHNDDRKAYAAVVRMATEVHNMPPPTFEQVRYQRNLAALSRNYSDARINRFA